MMHVKENLCILNDQAVLFPRLIPFIVTKGWAIVHSVSLRRSRVSQDVPITQAGATDVNCGMSIRGYPCTILICESTGNRHPVHSPPGVAEVSQHIQRALVSFERSCLQPHRCAIWLGSLLPSCLAMKLWMRLQFTAHISLVSQCISSQEARCSRHNRNYTQTCLHGRCNDQSKESVKGDTSLPN